MQMLPQKPRISRGFFVPISGALLRDDDLSDAGTNSPEP